MLTIIERENHNFELPDGFNLAKDDDGKYHFIWRLPNDDDGHTLGFGGPFNTIEIAVEKSWKETKEWL